jgi:hypothetical protein
MMAAASNKWSVLDPPANMHVFCWAAAFAETNTKHARLHSCLFCLLSPSYTDKPGLLAHLLQHSFSNSHPVCCLFCSQIVGGATNKDFIHLWPCAMITAGLMLAFKCLSADQARSAIEWEVYICIAFAFAVRCASAMWCMPRVLC